MTNKNLSLILLASASLLLWSASLKLSVSIIFIALCFFSLNQHVTLGLIQLELLTLISSLVVALFMSLISSSMTFMMTLLMVGVLEGTAGLSLLALSTRTYSAELFKFNL